MPSHQKYLGLFHSLGAHLQNPYPQYMNNAPDQPVAGGSAYAQQIVGQALAGGKSLRIRGSVGLTPPRCWPKLVSRGLSCWSMRW